MQPAITAAFFPALPDGCFFGAAALSAAVLCAGRLASNLPFFLIRIPPIQKPQGDIIFFCIIHKPTDFCNGIPDRNSPRISEISINIFGGTRNAALQGHSGVSPTAISFLSQEKRYGRKECLDAFGACCGYVSGKP